MTRIKLSDRIYDANGVIAVASDLLDQGRAIVCKDENIESRRSKSGTVTWYRLALVDDNGNVTDYGYDIGQKAYESRAKIGQHIPPKQRGSQTGTARPSISPAVFDGQFVTVTNVPQWGEHRIPAHWDEESQSFEVVVSNDEIGGYIHRAMKAANFPVFEYDTGMYEETLVINFCPEGD